MGKKKRGLIWRLLPYIIIFAAGTGFGYYVRDQRQDRRLQEAIERAGNEIVDRSRELGESVTDSARSAIRRLAGDTT